jgi:hypothetical protein
MTALKYLVGRRFMTIIEKVVDDLKHLPPTKLAKAVTFVNGLKRVRPPNRATVLAETAGALSGKEIAMIENAIAAGCERIDRRDW